MLKEILKKIKTNLKQIHDLLDGSLKLFVELMKFVK